MVASVMGVPGTGVPETIPLEESRESPEGNWPDKIVQVRGPEFPWAWSWRLNGTVITH